MAQTQAKKFRSEAGQCEHNAERAEKATDQQAWLQLADADKLKRLRQKLLVGFWILAFAISMTGWTAGLAWIAFLLIKQVV